MSQVVLLSLVLFFTFVNASAEEKLPDISEPQKVPVELRQDQYPDNNTITVTTTVRGGAHALPAGSGDSISMEHSRNAPVGFWGTPDSDSFSGVYLDEKILDTSEREKASVAFRQDQNSDNNTISITATVRGGAQRLPADSGEN